MNYQKSIKVTQVDSSFDINRLLPWLAKFGGQGNSNTLGWHDDQGSFLHKCYEQKVYDDGKKGRYWITEEDGEIINGFGVTSLHDSTRWAIYGSRTFGLQTFQKLGPKGLQPHEHIRALNEVAFKFVTKNYDGYIIAHNTDEYHKKLFDKLAKINFATISEKRGDYYFIKERLIIPCWKWPYTVNVNYTPQNIVYFAEKEHLHDLQNYLHEIRAY